MAKALLVIDVQNEYFTGKLPIHNRDASLENILKAIDYANSAGIKIVLIKHVIPNPEAPVFAVRSFGAELKKEVTEQPHNLIIEKNLPGSFTGTGLEEWLRTNHIDALTICGYMTHLCCDTTSRQAVHLGYKVEFLSDATGTLDLSNNAGSVDAKTLHETILIVQAARFADVLTTEAWCQR